tara:strand:- start:275 stop:520 length:246 start_codon:yes stop_codon:yes gene_type:complete
MSGLPQILDVDDGLTIDRDLAVEATRHILLAMKLILGVPTLQGELLLDRADSQVSYMLGGDHWMPIARELIDSVLEQEAES